MLLHLKSRVLVGLLLIGAGPVSAEQPLTSEDARLLVRQLRIQCFQSQLIDEYRPPNSLEQQLIDAGPLAVDPLVQRLRTPRARDERFARAAMHVLGEIGDARAAGVLIKNLSPDLAWLCEESAAKALVKLDNRIAPQLLKALQDETKPTSVRVQLARLLAQKDADLALQPLMELAGKQQLWGIAMLAENGRSEVRVALLNALIEHQYYAGIKGLGKIKYRSAIPALIKLLDNEVPYDSRRYVRVAAIEALGEIGDPAAIPALARQLVHKEESPWVNQTPKNAAIVALGKIGDRRAFDSLVHLVRSGSRFDKRLLLEALVAIDPVASVPYIIQTYRKHVGHPAIAKVGIVAESSEFGLASLSNATSELGEFGDFGCGEAAMGAMMPDLFHEDCIRLLDKICRDNLDPIVPYFEDKVVGERLLLPVCLSSRDPDKLEKLHHLIDDPNHALMPAAFEAICDSGNGDAVGDILAVLTKLVQRSQHVPPYLLDPLFRDPDSSLLRGVVEASIERLDPNDKTPWRQFAYIHAIVGAKDEFGCKQLSRLYRSLSDQAAYPWAQNYLEAIHRYPDSMFLPDLQYALDKGRGLGHVHSTLVKAKEDSDLVKALRRCARTVDFHRGAYFAMATLREMRDPGLVQILKEVVVPKDEHSYRYVLPPLLEYRTREAIGVLFDVYYKWNPRVKLSLKVLDHHDFDALLELANDQDPNRRALAMRYLCKIGVPHRADEVSAVLVKNLADDDLETRVNAAAALCYFRQFDSLSGKQQRRVTRLLVTVAQRITWEDPTRDDPQLLMLAGKPARMVVSHGVIPLPRVAGAIGATEAVVDCLDGSSPGNWYAMLVLGGLGDLDSIPDLDKQLLRPHRNSAVAGLRKYRSQGTPHLLRLIKGGEPAIRQQAAHGLAFNQATNVEFADQILDMIDSEQDEYVRQMLLYAVTRSRSPKAIDHMAKMLCSDNHGTRRAAAEGLAAIGTREAFQKAEQQLPNAKADEQRRPLIWLLNDIQRGYMFSARLPP